VARALEGLSGPNGPAALVDFTTTDSSGPVLLDLYLHPEGIGAVLFHADVMRACGVPMEVPGSLARATAVVRVAVSFDVVAGPTSLTTEIANVQPTQDELIAFGTDAFERFAIEDLYPRLRTDEGSGHQPESLLECASHLLGVGRLTEGFILGAQAQALLERRDSGIGTGIDRPLPPREPTEVPGVSRVRPRDPLVSVIIPTLDRPEMLTRALESVSRRTFSDLEVIVVNDGGAAPHGVIDRFRDRIGPGDRITLATHDQSRGPSAARNTGVALARGRYVNFLDDDDRLLPNHLAALVPVALLGAPIVHGDVRSVVETAARPLPLATAMIVRYQFDYREEHYRVDNCFPIQSILCERELILQAGGFDETIPVLEDWDLWLRVFEIAQPIRVRRMTSEVRQREDRSNLTWRSNDVWLEVFAHIYEKTLRFERIDPTLRRERVKNLVSLGEQRGRAFPRGAVGWLQGDATLPPIEPTNPLAAWGDRQEARSENGRPPAPRPEPSCSIVIPCLNRMDLTKQCLEALFTVTDGVPYEVIVVDNGSDDGTAEYLSSLGERIRVISNPENQGFAIACNQGARAATGEYVVFLNNDTVPLRGWLRAMVDVVRTEPGVGIVGSKLLFPDRSVQHIGVSMSREFGTPYHIYRGAPEDAPVASRRRDLNCVTAACMLVRKSEFEEVGGFDEGYRNSFEDIDLCFRMVQRGYRVVYEPASVLLHLESQTSGRKDHDPHNMRRFVERWSDPSWLDEERVYAEDGYVIVRSDPPRIRPFLDDDERVRWMRVAEVQFRAPREGVAALGTLLEPSDWPRERPILAWGESLCTASGLPGLAARFRAEHDSLPEDTELRAGA
jgi:GT2 family glycosyltransferase